jgi:hypothetical protein
MRQRFGDRQDLPIAGSSFHTKNSENPKKASAISVKKSFGKGLLEEREVPQRLKRGSN